MKALSPDGIERAISLAQQFGASHGDTTLSHLTLQVAKTLPEVLLRQLVTRAQRVDRPESSSLWSTPAGRQFAATARQVKRTLVTRACGVCNNDCSTARRSHGHPVLTSSVR